MDRSYNMRSVFTILAVAGASLAASCSGNDTYLSVTVERGTAVGDIDRIDLTLDFNGEQATRALEKGGTALTLPTTAVFQIMNGQGTMLVTAKASRQNVEVLRGKTSGEIRRGTNNAIIVQLGRESLGDGGTDGVPGTTLVANPTALPFGAVAVGQPSLVQTVTISNQAQQETGALMVSSESSAFVVQTGGANDCGVGATTTKLAAGASCTVRVVFTPPAAGDVNAKLTVSAAPGGAVDVSMSGRGAAPGALAFSPSTLELGTTTLGVAATREIVLENTGGADLGGLQFAVEGSGAAQFAIAANDCNGKVAGYSHCTLTFALSATVAGTFSATVSATSGAVVAVANLTGTVLKPGSLEGDATGIDFGDQEVGVASAAKTWTITNKGATATAGVPTFSNSNPSEFVATNGCTAALDPGASCTVSITFKPGAGGSRTSTLSLVSGTASASVALKGRGMYRVTLNRVVGGAACSGCTVQSADAAKAIDCGSTCTSASVLVAPGTSLTLQSRTQNGSGHWFSGWSGADTLCEGPARDCTFVVNGTAALTATFSAMTNNLAFHSSTPAVTNLGSAKAYDGVCNTAATAAGINNATGNGYVAWVSDAVSLASTRVGGTGSQGWVRMDGRVVATTKTNLLANRVILNPIIFDENGTRRAANVLTGTYEDGTLASMNCGNWTSASSAVSYLGGMTDGGPTYWTAGFGSGCGSSARVLCLGVTGTATAVAVATTGKRAWTTSSVYSISTSGTPDEFCNANRPTGVTSAKALVARTTASAGSLLIPAQVYVRIDGQRVGTGADIAAGVLETGIWQSNAATGAYLPVGMNRVWTGAWKPSAVGTAAGTCGNWADRNQTAGVFGIPSLAGDQFFGFSSQACNVATDELGQLYCFEP